VHDSLPRLIRILRHGLTVREVTKIVALGNVDVVPLKTQRRIPTPNGLGMLIVNAGNTLLLLKHL
jgi:hypothetical protein